MRTNKKQIINLKLYDIATGPVHYNFKYNNISIVLLFYKGFW